MPPAILIDISAAVNQGAGIGRYGRELTRELIPLLREGTARLWYALDQPAHDADLLAREPWCSVPARRSPLSRRNVDRLQMRGGLALGRLLNTGKASDAYSPDFTAPTVSGARIHITIHDLAWLHPEAQTPAPLADYLAPVVERAVRDATTIFTVSATVRQEILSRWQLPEDRVIVASNAAAERFFRALAPDPDHLVTFGLQRPFLLYVGTIEPRKNLEIVFEAMRHLPPEVRLGLVGRPGWQGDEILRHLDRPELRERVLPLGFISDELLPGLISASAGLVYPSRYEGFGLPIIEGLAAGAPVAASDLPVFHEVGGDEVTFFDPGDATSVAQALERLIAEDAHSGSAIARRRAQARRFGWHTSAMTVARRLTAGF